MPYDLLSRPGWGAIRDQVSNLIATDGVAPSSTGNPGPTDNTPERVRLELCNSPSSTTYG
jgi:hypothetical protein